MIPDTQPERPRARLFMEQVSPDEWREILDYLNIAGDELRRLAHTATSKHLKQRMTGYAHRCDTLRDKVQRLHLD